MSGEELISVCEIILYLLYFVLVCRGSHQDRSLVTKCPKDTGTERHRLVGCGNLCHRPLANVKSSSFSLIYSSWRIPAGLHSRSRGPQWRNVRLPSPRAMWTWMAAAMDAQMTIEFSMTMGDAFWISSHVSIDSSWCYYAGQWTLEESSFSSTSWRGPISFFGPIVF